MVIPLPYRLSEVFGLPFLILRGQRGNHRVVVVLDAGPLGATGRAEPLELEEVDVGAQRTGALDYDDPMIAALPPQNEEWKEANGY